MKPNPSATETPIPTGQDLPVGTDEPFWLANIAAKTYSRTTARIVFKTAHAYWYEQDGSVLSISDIQTAGNYFEEQTYQIEHRLFGSEKSPGPDGDVHITVLLAQIPGVGGYFSSSDAYPAAIHTYSNARNMIYINVGSVRPGATSFNGTVAHEFMHMIQFNVHRNEDSWVNEGSAEIAAQAVTGNVSSGVSAFERRPDTQLDAWASDPQSSIAHYGAAYLFLRYVAEHFGGPSTIGKIVASPGRGLEIFSNYFSSLNPVRTFDEVFGEWIAANYLGDNSTDNGRYGYQGLQLNIATSPGPIIGGPVTLSATQYGARYYNITASQPSVLSIDGSPTVPLIAAPTEGHPRVWWSNRGDSIDTRLTRPVNLASVTSASLHFSTWYDIEDGYDYGYVEASRDGGKSWSTLAASTTTTLNPNGQNYGNGFSGSSGDKPSGWTQQSVDLTAYAGSEFLLRFEYVTDDSYNGDGMALDNIEIPEIGFRDSPDVAIDWQTEGFTRIVNQTAETYLVEELTKGATHPSTRITVDAGGHATIPLASGQVIVLAVAGLAPLTTQPAAVTLNIVAK